MKAAYIEMLVDDFGIYHHTDGKKWMKSTGYSLDDAARGLLFFLLKNDRKRSKILFSYIEKSRVAGDFFGFSTSNRKFYTSPSSEDAKGQCVWAIGYGLSLGYKKSRSKLLLSGIGDSLLNMNHVRGQAYALLGAIYFDKTIAKRLAKKVTDGLRGRAYDWYWPETKLTYGNGILPYSLIRYGLAFNDKEAGRCGKLALEFLEKVCSDNRQLGPIGNEGWHKKSQASPPDFSQQPVDTAYMVMAWLAQYQASGDKECLKRAKQWMMWFEGKNIAGKKMYRPDNLQCFDGINESGINTHSGAESNICFLLARTLLEMKTSV